MQGPTAYQTKFDEQNALGRRLHRVQGYDNGNKFAAIWTAAPAVAAWAPGKTLNVGDKVTYNGIVYEVRISHITQATWTPPVTPNLFKRIQAHVSEVNWAPPFTPTLWTKTF